MALAEAKLAGSAQPEADRAAEAIGAKTGDQEVITLAALQKLLSDVGPSMVQQEGVPQELRNAGEAIEALRTAIQEEARQHGAVVLEKENLQNIIDGQVLPLL